jgi:predicted O-methyltransferase YrrM
MSVLDATLIKFLSIPHLDRPVEYLWHLYHTARLNSLTNHNHTEVFRAIEAQRLDIKSDFPERDAKALENVIQQVLKENIVIAEVGSWKGMSTAILAKTVSDFHGKVFAVDHWQGNEGVPEHKQSQTTDMLTLFRYNMRALNVSEYVYPLVMPSEIASSIFPDKSLDMVFIDADHRYEFIKQDIELWYPKVKDKGIIAGHDCEGRYATFGKFRKEIEAHLNEDVIVGICHPGVVKATWDVFGNDFQIEGDSSIWWKRKE